MENWLSYQKLHEDGKVKFDCNGRLRYPHGAPVGDMVCVSVNKRGKAKYKESTDEWFDPDSLKAKMFVWPKPSLLKRIVLILFGKK